MILMRQGFMKVVVLKVVEGAFGSRCQYFSERVLALSTLG